MTRLRIETLLTSSAMGLLGALAPAHASPGPRSEPAVSANTSQAAGAVPSSGRTWKNRRFVYQADGKRLTEVLNDFAASQGLPAIIAEGVEGVVQARFDTSAEEFLNAMGKAYGLLWYHDGTALYIYPAKAIQSRIFRIKGFSRAQVESLLDSLQLGDKRYALRFSARDDTLMAYGPPRHIDLVAAALESLDASVAERNQQVVRVFTLRFASAQDRRFGDNVIPGMASTLRAIYGQPEASRAAPASANTAPAAQKVRAMTAAYGAPITDPARKNDTASPQDANSMGLASRGMHVPPPEDPQAVFQADEGTNTVIVRGRADRMADYAAVIQRLDVKPTLVEIEAMIIDVSTDSMSSLGIAWSASGDRARVSVTPPGAPGAATPSVPGNFSISTLWANAGREFLSRVDALQADGKARVVAKPKVLGVANRPAIMKENRVVNVRVASNLDANLFRVEAGTQLQVTPQITLKGDASRIKLSLYIVDGNFEDITVDSVPVVKHTEISTEAHVTEGESLLIGGITVEAKSNKDAGVPGLSRIPLLGAMFRWSESQSKRSERLFLITPRLVHDMTQLPLAAVSAEAATTPPPMPLSAAPLPASPGDAPLDR